MRFFDVWAPCFTSKWGILLVSVLTTLLFYIILDFVKEDSPFLHYLSGQMEKHNLTKSTIACNQTFAEQSFKRGTDLHNLSFTLTDIDRVATLEIGEHNCSVEVDPSREKFIIVVPYRDRKRDLLAFLLHIYPYFDYQGVKMEIMVVEQNGKAPFNRAKLFNAAVRELDKINDRPGKGDLGRLAGIACFALHDVDKLPANPDVPYHCCDGPHQLLRYWKRQNESFATYSNYLGGVTMFTRNQLEKMNGASNAFTGWGGEDDDMSRRVRLSGMKVVLAPVQKGTFYEGDYEHGREINPNRFKVLLRPNQEQIMMTDGLRQVNYTFLKRVDYRTFVWFLVDV